MLPATATMPRRAKSAADVDAPHHVSDDGQTFVPRQTYSALQIGAKIQLGARQNHMFLPIVSGGQQWHLVVDTVSRVSKKGANCMLFPIRLSISCNRFRGVFTAGPAAGFVQKGSAFVPHRVRNVVSLQKWIGPASG